MSIAAVCHNCGGRFGVLAVAPPSACPHCRTRLDVFRPEHVIRNVICSGTCGVRLAITFEPLTGARPDQARCPVCGESWNFRNNLLHQEVPFEPIVCVDLGD